MGWSEETSRGARWICRKVTLMTLMVFEIGKKHYILWLNNSTGIISPFLMGNTSSKGPFSIDMWVYRRVNRVNLTLKGLTSTKMCCTFMQVRRILQASCDDGLSLALFACCKPCNIKLHALNQDGRWWNSSWDAWLVCKGKNLEH